MQLVGRPEAQARIVNDVAELGEHLGPADGRIHILQVIRVSGEHSFGRGIIRIRKVGRP